MNYERLKYTTEDIVNHITVHWGTEGKGCYSVNTEIKIFDLFKKMLSFTGGDVLEIGPGRGKFANLLLNNNLITSYTCLDLKKNFPDSQVLLGDRVAYVESKDYEQTWNKHYTLFVATFVLSEVPDYYKKNLYNHVIPNCDNVFIIDGDTNSKVSDFENTHIYNFDEDLVQTIKLNFAHVEVIDSGMHNGLAIAGKK